MISPLVENVLEKTVSVLESRVSIPDNQFLAIVAKIDLIEQKLDAAIDQINKDLAIAPCFDDFLDQTIKSLSSIKVVKVLQPIQQRSDKTIQSKVLIDPITQFEFDNIPLYIRKRNTLVQLNKALASLNSTIGKIHKLTITNPNKLSTSQRDVIMNLKEFKDDGFVVTESILREEGYKFDNEGRSLLSVVRYLQRIKEVRDIKGVRLVVV